MRKNVFKIILFFSLFLLLFSVKGYAELTIPDSWELPTDPTTYTPNKIYRFNVTVCDDNGYSNVDTVLFEWHNEPNITVTDSFNITENCSVFSTTKNDLSANESGWTYKWYANNTTGGDATPLIDSYTINKLNPISNMHIEINGTDDDTTLIYPNATNVKAWNDNYGDNDCFYGFYRDDINLTSTLNEENSFGVGTYNYIYNVTNCTNYTDNSTTRTLTVSEGYLPIHLYLNGTEDNKTDGNSYDLYDIANFSVLLNTSGVVYELANKTVYLKSDFPFSQNSNNSTFFNYTIDLTTAGLFNLTAYWNGDANYSSSSKTYFFGVKPYWINNMTSVDSGSNYSSGQSYQFNITWIGDIENVSFEADFLVDNSFNYTDNTSIKVNNDTNGNYWITFTDLAANPSGYSYRWYANDTNGNSVKTDNWNYVISKIPVNLSWTSPTSWTFNVGTDVTVRCDSNPDLNLTLGITGYSAVYSFTLGTVSTSVSSSTADTFSCFCRPTDTTNYSGYITATLNFQTTDGGTGTGTGGGGDDYTPTGSFLIKDLTSSLSVEAGESKSTTFKLSNTLSSNMKNVNISLTGISSTWYSLSKTSISLLKRDVPESVTITFSIPEDAEAKDYSVTVTAKGKPLVGSTRTTTKTMKLKVTAPTAPEIQPLEEVEEAVIGTTEENITSNETAIGVPTGLAAAFEYLKNNLVIVIAIASCLLIFIFRNNITTSLMKATGRKVPKKVKKMKLPSLSKYKLAIRLKRGKGRKKEVLEKEPEVRRPEALEREIKRDIKELQEILEAEKKIEKKKKKFDLENN